MQIYWHGSAWMVGKAGRQRGVVADIQAGRLEPYG